MAICNPSLSILSDCPGCMEIFFRSVSIVLSFPTFVCAANAVNKLNADAISLMGMEPSRDEAVAGAGMVVGVALLTMLMESVIIVLRFCTEGVWNAVVDIVIHLLFALVYFCLLISMAVFADKWKNLEVPSGAIPNDVSTIGDSLAAASVFCSFLWIIFSVLGVAMCIITAYKWNEQETSECHLSKAIVDVEFPQRIVEVIIRSFCIVLLGFPTFVSAATAVNNLRAYPLSLGQFEQLRDNTTAAAGMVVFMGLLTMLTEVVVIAMRFCTKLSVLMDMLIDLIFAVMYFGLGIPMATFSEQWNVLESSDDIPNDVMTIHGALAAASVLCFSSVIAFIILAGLMCLFLVLGWNTKLNQAMEYGEVDHLGGRRAEDTPLYYARPTETTRSPRKREEVHHLGGRRPTKTTRSPIKHEAIRHFPKATCTFREVCTRYFATLRIKDDCLNPRYDKCFCEECLGPRHTKQGILGRPPKEFAVPVGWMKFGVLVSLYGQRVFQDWHVCYHGTAPHKVKTILESGGLRFRGDTTMSGRTISAVKGHFYAGRKIFVSPSVRYCAHGAYAKTARYHDTKTCKTYEAKVVLQVRIKPGTYDIAPETVGATSTIDPLFSNDVLEWSTEEEKVTVIYGILVQLEQD